MPIKLKNGKVASTFENLTGMYAYPRYNEIDPTPLFTPFYILFFGMKGKNDEDYIKSFTNLFDF